MLADAARLNPVAPRRPSHRPTQPAPVQTAPPSFDTTDSAAGSVVTPMIGGGTIFPKAHEMLQNAQSSIKLEMYEFENPQFNGTAETTSAAGSAEQQQLLGDLVAAAKRGVNVQVILDGSKQKDGSAKNDAIKQYLQSNGVNVLTYPTKAVNIDHVKLLLTDGTNALIGGMNWGDHSPANHDADVFIQGAGAQNLDAHVFEPDWQFAGGEASNVGTVADSTVTPLTTMPKAEGGETSIHDAVLNQLQQAQNHAYVEMYTLTSQDILDQMVAAKNRGVDVKVLLDPSERHTNQKAFDQLSQAGVPVRWYVPEKGLKQLLHAKWGEFDGQSLIIGSGNWSSNGLGATRAADEPEQLFAAGPHSSSRHNHEADVLVKDAGTANAFETQFQQDWATHSSGSPREF